MNHSRFPNLPGAHAYAASPARPKARPSPEFGRAFHAQQQVRCSQRAAGSPAPQIEWTSHVRNRGDLRPLLAPTKKKSLKEENMLKDTNTTTQVT